MPFHTAISLQVIERLEFERAYYDVTVQCVNHHSACVYACVWVCVHAEMFVACLGLWRINACGLFNAKCCLFIYIKSI